MQKSKHFVPPGALEQGSQMYFSYDQTHAEYTEMKVMWV